MTTKAQHTTDATLATLTTARARHALLHIEGYCRSDGCPGRELRIYVKDYDRELLDHVTRRGLTCPICGGPLAIHWVHTPLEHTASQEQQARWSVNTQMYERDHAQPGALVGIPADVMCREELPPTPPGYWDPERRRNGRGRSLP